MSCEVAGERGFVELIRQALLPVRSGQHQPLPIVVLWSPSRSGKSTLLDQVHKRFHRGRPSARHCGADFGNRRPHEVALQLADHLGRYVERFGRLQFPRLFLGMLAIKGPVGEAATTRSEMIRRTIPDRGRLKQWARDTSGTILDAAEAEKSTKIVIGMALEGALATLEAVPLLRGRALSWYRDALNTYCEDPVDALIQLAADETAGRRDSVDEVLCRAFLADLRDGCSNKFHQLYDRNLHCLAVLDDADTPAVHAFFKILRIQRANQWDPLLIVAGSSKKFSTADNENPEEWPIRPADKASYGDWIENRTVKKGWLAVYPVTLDGSTEAEAITCFVPKTPAHTQRLLGDGIDVAEVPGGAEHAVTLAHQLTNGHLGGLHLVLRAMTLERARVEDTPMDLRRLLDWATADKVPLADTVLKWVVGSWPANIRHLLICGSAARDFGDTALARVLHDMPARQLLLDFRSRDTWVRHGTGPPTLHPLARRALLRQLAKPGEPGWNEVHGRLGQLAESHGDTTSAMYHALAEGRVGEVARTLSRQFSDLYTAQWFTTLLAVTQAPVQNPARKENSESHCTSLADAAGAGHLVSGRLISALQLHADPLADPNHDLCQVVAHELEALADHAPEGGLVFLLRQAARFRGCHSPPVAVQPRPEEP